MADSFTPREAPALPADPYPVTIVTSNDADYEYARRHTTTEAPADVGSLGTGKIAILGTQTSPSFYKSIDIVVGIASAVGQHASVHSEPYLFTGIATISNTRLTNAWHFRADPFTGTQGVGSTWGVGREFGFAFSNPGLANNSYGFYYGSPTSPSANGKWGVFIDNDASNYFKDLVLVGDYTSVGSGGATNPEPILQVFDNNSKQGSYVESISGVGIAPDTRYQLNVKQSVSATLAGRFEGDVKVEGDAEVTGNVSVGGNELSISVSGTDLIISVTGIGSVTLALTPPP